MEQEEWWVWPLLGLLGFIGLIKFWQSTVRPWLQEVWTGLRTGEASLTLPGGGALDGADLVALAVMVLVVTGAVVSAVRAQRRRRVLRRLESAKADASTKKGRR